MDNKIGVYVCHCGSNIGGVIDVPAVIDFARGLDSVVVARDYKFMCSDPGQDRGLITAVNLIVATQHNAAPICMSVKKAAKALIKGPEVKEGLLNMVEMSFRAYDPCLGCATHSLNEPLPITINLRDSEKRLLKTLRQ